MSPNWSLKSRFQKILGIEKKAGIAAPEPWLFDLFGGAPNTSGIAITPRVAMTCAPVNCAVRVISESVGQLPVHVFKRSSDGAKSRATDHPVYRLLHDAANEWTPAFEFRRQLTQDALLHHGGFAFINRVDGRPVELLRLQPQAVTVKPDEVTGEPTYAIAEGNGLRPLARQDVIHIRAPFTDGHRDEPLIRLAADSIGLCLQMERHAARLMANGARPSGLLALKGNITPDTLKNAKAAWNAQHSAANSGGTAVIPSDVSWQSMTFSSVDAEFMEMRKFAINEIARVFRVPPSMLYALERVTHSNGEQLGSEFITFTLMSWIKRWEGEVSLKLFSPDERANYYAEFLTDDLARADLATRVEAQVKQIAARIINPNEARAQNNMQPYAGGDRFENPNTTASGAAA